MAQSDRVRGLRRLCDRDEGGRAGRLRTQAEVVRPSILASSRLDGGGGVRSDIRHIDIIVGFPFRTSCGLWWYKSTKITDTRSSYFTAQFQELLEILVLACVYPSAVLWPKRQRPDAVKVPDTAAQAM